MKKVTWIVLLISVILLSGCSKSGISINDEILDEKQAEEMKINKDLIGFDDFELLENVDWLIPIDDNEISDPKEGPYLREEEFNELERQVLEKMKAEKLDIDGMYLIRNDNDFLVFWNRKKGKVYLYEYEKESLQFLLDTDIPKEEPEEGWPVSVFFVEDFLLRGATNEDSLYYATEKHLYRFNREGKQLLKREIPDGFKVETLQEDYGVFLKEEKAYIYSYDEDTMTHVFDRDILDYYQNYIIFQEENKIYFVNIYEEKIYYHQEEIKDMKTILLPESEKIYFIDNNKIDLGPRRYKINLPNK